MTERESEGRGFWRSRSSLVLIGFLAIAGYFVITEHRAHAIQTLPYLPYLLLFLCPLLHLFHGGHGGHDDGQEDKRHDHRENER